MNNKGFTLIELLATIILLAIIMTISTASVIGTMNAAKQKSFEVLAHDIEIATGEYYQECGNADIIPTTINCDSINTKSQVSVKNLIEYGFLKTNNADNKETKYAEDPRNNDNLNECIITVITNQSEDGGILYSYSASGTTKKEKQCSEVLNEAMRGQYDNNDQ